MPMLTLGIALVGFAVLVLMAALVVRHKGQKLILSTRGREVLLGSTKKLFVGLTAFATTLVAAGALIAIVKPGEARPCGTLKDGQKLCVVKTEMSTTDEMQADGSTKKVPIRHQVMKWEVTKQGKWQVEAKRQPRAKGRLAPSIAVTDKWGLPMAVDLKIMISDEAASDNKVKTKNLEPGTYEIDLWSNANGPDEMLLGIEPAPQTEASK